MSEEKLSLQTGIAYMDRCLDAELASQRSIAHSAIDMDDWEKAQEILTKSKEAISRVEMLRGKFAEFKRIAASILEGTAAPEHKASEHKASEHKAPEHKAPEIMAFEMTAPEPEKKPAEPAKPSFSFVNAIEDLIGKHPYTMAQCHSAQNMNKFFTMDEATARSDFKKPVQLSNAMWVETEIPDDKAHLLVDALRKYCDRKQG